MCPLPLAHLHRPRALSNLLAAPHLPASLDPTLPRMQTANPSRTLSSSRRLMISDRQSTSLIVCLHTSCSTSQLASLNVSTQARLVLQALRSTQPGPASPPAPPSTHFRCACATMLFVHRQSSAGSSLHLVEAIWVSIPAPIGDRGDQRLRRARLRHSMRLATEARMNPSTRGFKMKSSVFGRSRLTQAGKQQESVRSQAFGLRNTLAVGESMKHCKAAPRKT